MWIKKTKLRAEYSKFKDRFSKYIERSAQFKPHLDLDSTLNRVILNKVKRGCSFFISACHITEEKISTGTNRNCIGKIFSRKLMKMLNGFR